MAQKTPYNLDLDRNPANFQPLTPLTFLERAAAVFPEHIAVIHGPLRRSYREFYARSRRLASALAKRSIKHGDTVAVVLANSPAMLEAHYGVPMCGAVLNTINTRLDAATIGFIFDQCRRQGGHRRPRVFQSGEGGSQPRQNKTAGDRFPRSGFFRRRRADRRDRIRGFLETRRSGFRVADATRRMGRDLAQLHLGHHRRSQGRGVSSSRRLSACRRQRGHRRHGQAPGLSVDAADVPLQRLRASPGRCRWLPARMCAFGRCARRQRTTPSPLTR